MDNNSKFEKVFFDLKQMGERISSAEKTYELLKKLNDGTTDAESDDLINEFNEIQYTSNANDFFYFYFPLVSHILYYKPKYEIVILKYLIGPNFANGTTETQDMIGMIIRAMKYKLSEDENYLTHESQDWIVNEFPKLERQIDREIQACWKELDG